MASTQVAKALIVVDRVVAVAALEALASSIAMICIMDGPAAPWKVEPNMQARPSETRPESRTAS
jgi:hypothetical protein